MKKLCTIFATLALSMLVAIPILASPDERYKYDSTIHVAAPSPELKASYDAANTYDNLMRDTVFSQYYVPVQPIDALNLKTTVNLTKPIEGAYVNDSNESVTVWNLPILKQEYYYTINNNDIIAMPDYTYPVLTLTANPPATVSIPLRIMRRGRSEDAQVALVELVVSGGVNYGKPATGYMDDSSTLTIAHKGLSNQTWRFSYEGYFYPYETREAVFCEDFVVSAKTIDIDPNLYVLKDNYTLVRESAPSAQTYRELGYRYSSVQFEGLLSTTTASDIGAVNGAEVYSWYADELKPTGSSYEHLLTYAIGPKQDIDRTTNVYTHQSQRLKFKGNTYEVIKGAEYCFFTPDECHLNIVPARQLTSPYTSIKVPPYKDVIHLTVNEMYPLRSLTAGYAQVIPLDHPSSRDESSSWQLVLDDSGEWCIRLKSVLNEDHNLAAVGLFNAYVGSVGAFGTGEEKTYTLIFDSRGGTEMDPLTVTMGMPATYSPRVNEVRRPTRENYSFQGWYVDASCVTPYNYKTFEASAGGTYTLYAKWELETGDYHVVFIDDINGTKTTRTFDTGSAPALPESPTATGYKFKNWQIVANETATAGTDYNPLTFKPEKGKTYYFRANWDVSGIITDVDVNKTSYYIGETINKDYIKVTIQTNADGTRRTLNSTEFTMTPATMNSEGLQSFTVQYTESGATATIHLNGINDNLVSITAQYNGSTLTVGTRIPTNQVKVTGTYASGRTTTLSNFTLSPATVNVAGDNRITVTSSGLSTTMLIPGRSSSSSNNNNNDKTLRNITASYTGGTCYVGDYLDSSKFNVIAYYSNGESTKVSDGSFSISPRSLSKSGTQTITIGYSGFTTTLQLNVSEKSYTTSTRSTSSSSTYRPSSSSTTRTTTNSSSNPYSNRPGASNSTSNANNTAPTAVTRTVNPDGSTTVHNSDGSVTTTTADGRTTTTNPTTTTTGGGADPNRTTTVVNGRTVGDQVVTTSGMRVDENGKIITGGATDDALIALGGRGLAQSGDKGISPYYLEGKWVMDVFPDSQEIVSDSTSILDELKKLDTHISAATILRTNGGNNNNFTKECIDYVRSNLNTTTLTFKMVKDQTSGTEVAEWTILGARMPESVTVDDICMLNVAVKQFDRTDGEIIIGVGTTMSAIPDYATLKVDTSKYFPTVSRTTTKAYDAKYTVESDYLNGTFKNKSNEPEDYVISDGVILDSTTKFGSKVFSDHLDDTYEYDSFFEQQPVWSASAPRSDGSEVEDVVEDEGWDEGWDDVTPTQEDDSTSKKEIPTWMFFVLGGVIILGVGAGAFIIIRSRRNLTLPVQNPVDDFPEATSDQPYQYDDQYEGEYTDEEYDDEEYSEDDYEDDDY